MLFLTAVMPFTSTYFFVAASILAITVFVVLPLREKAMTEAEATIHAARNIVEELKRFVREAWIAFTGSRAAWVGVIAALLPAGAYALSLALQSNLAVELGLDDDAIAQLNVVCTLVNAVCCILGGWLSDRFGRRSTLALFVALTIVPTLWLAWVMWKAGWIMPVEIDTPNRPHPSTALIFTFWAACIVYNVFQGLYYGIRTALYHGHHDAGGGGHAVHGLHGDAQPVHLLHVVVARLRGRAHRLPGDVGGRFRGGPVHPAPAAADEAVPAARGDGDAGAGAGLTGAPGQPANPPGSPGAAGGAARRQRQSA